MCLRFLIASRCIVYVTSSSQNKIDTAVKLGAYGGFLYTDENIASTIKSKNLKFNAIIDGSTGKNFPAYIDVIQPGGTIVMYGATGGEIPNINPRKIFWKQIRIIGTTMGNVTDFQNMLAFVQSHKIIPTISSTFSLNEINGAFDTIKNHSQFSKIVIEI